MTEKLKVFFTRPASLPRTIFVTIEELNLLETIKQFFAPGTKMYYDTKKREQLAMTVVYTRPTLENVVQFSEGLDDSDYYQYYYSVSDNELNILNSLRYFGILSNHCWRYRRHYDAIIDE